MGGMCVGRSQDSGGAPASAEAGHPLDIRQERAGQQGSPTPGSGGKAAACPPSSAPRRVCRDARPDTEGLFPPMPRVSSSGRCGDPGATVTTCHKPGVSQQQRFLSRSSGHWKYTMKVCWFLLELKGICPGLSWLLWSPEILGAPGLGAASHPPLPPCHVASPLCLCLDFPLLIRTPAAGLRGLPDPA